MARRSVNIFLRISGPLLAGVLTSAPTVGAGPAGTTCPTLSQGAGHYFSKKAYDPAPLPKYADVRDKLPSPIDDEHPLWVETYWKAWELAFRNFHEPPPNSGFVSQFIDAGFSANAY